MANEYHVSLKEHFEKRIEELEKATTKAARQLEHRLEGMNEFRSALKDQTAMYITKSEFKRIEEDIRMLRESRVELAGKASQKSVNLAVVGAILSFVMSLIFALLSVK